MSLDKFLMLLGILCQNPLFGIAVWDVLLLTEIVHHVLATETELRFERAWTVVDASMDDLGNDMGSEVSDGK